MLPNPYTPGEVPRVLAGRRQQSERIRAYTARIATYGEMGGPLLVFQGPRGVGKTSLLRDAQRDAEEHGFVTAWTACRRGAGFLGDLVDRVPRAVEDADVVPRSERTPWRMTLDRVAVQIGVPAGVKVEAAASRTSSPSPSDSVRQSAFEDLLHDTSNRVRRRGGAGLLLFVDELHAPRADDVAVLLNAVQNLSARREDNPLAVIGAGLPSTPAVLTSAATFGERSAFVTLPRLDRDAAHEAVVRPAGQLDVAWTDAAVDAVIAEAQGFPYLLQVLAHATWDAVRPVAGARLDLVAARAGFDRADDQLAAMYAARWEAATELERRMMAAMARIGGAVVARSAVAAALGRPTRSLSVPRSRLIEKGIVEPAGHGELRFTIPGFDRWVRETVDAD